MCEMRNSSLLVKITVIIVICCCCLSAQAKYGGGTGDPNDPYLIFDANQMNAIGADANDWDKCFKLMADIDLGQFTGTSFNIIGYYRTYFDYDPFTGVFDGNGHTISNFTYDSNGINNIGLFGHIEGEDARIQSLGLIEPNVSVGTGSIVGSLIGYLRQSGVDGCYVQYGFVSGADSVGGLVGKSWDGSISNCYSTGSVEGNNGIGGLIGGNENQHSNISNCNFTGNVSGASSVGGLAGGNSGRITGCCSTGSVTGGNRAGGLAGGNNCIISNCYSDANVSGYEYVGGLVASNWGGIYNSYSTGIVAGEYYVGGLVGNSHYEGFGIFNCYSEGSVTGVDSVGGLAGYNYGSSISECYSVGGVSGTTNVGGFLGYDDRTYINIYVGGFWDSDVNPDLSGIGNIDDPNVVGLPTVEMQTESTFVDAGWDFTLPVWTIDEGNDYPRLWWEGPEPSYGGGTGTEEYPYLIYTPEHLNAIGRHLNGLYSNFRLCADIDMSDFAGTEFNVIGDSWYTSFTGVFDGNGHTISNFTYVSNGINCIGLFGHIDNQIAEVKNLGLIEPNVSAGIGVGVGALVGYIYRGTVTNCYVIGGKVAGNGYIGGLVGDNMGGEISSCYSTACVTGDSMLGGLAGRNNGDMSNCYSTSTVTGAGVVGGLTGMNDGNINNCYSTGDVTASDDKVGGLVGINWENIYQCYSTGFVIGHSEVGGLVGFNRKNIYNCYSAGSVMGEDKVGGLVGYHIIIYGKNTVIYKSYSSSNVSGSADVGGLVGYDRYYYDYDDLYHGDYAACFWDSDVNPDMNGIGNGSEPNVVGLPTVEMQTESTFTDVGWDFVGETANGPNDIWDICEGMNYPKFLWQVPVGDFLCPDGVNFFDYSFFAGHWAEENCGASNDCDGRDLDLLGSVDIKDLRIFADNWLAGF